MEVVYDVVVDHHKESPANGFQGVFINLKNGSCCGIVWDLIKKCDFAFEDDNDYDSRVATAMLVGIATDTENLMSEDTTEYEFRAWREIFEAKDGTILRRIMNYARPKAWIEAEADAVKAVEIEDGVAVVGLGLVAAKHRDMIADMAQKMVQWEDVNTAIAFACVNGDRIEGSVRSNNASVIVTELCKKLGGKHGDGGGKLGKGAYRYNLGGAAVDEEDDEEVRQKLWNVFAEKERKRILRVISK
jgi:nanoRNase/pAp phosphatase (c-di-AMP/oligoRNAs hydrolase)